MKRAMMVMALQSSLGTVVVMHGRRERLASARRLRGRNWSSTAASA